ncbi:MAG: hypothetical protein R6X02_35130 [Enhygromyxa sp.]
MIGAPAPIFYLHVRSRGCTAEIRLNDAPIFAVTREAAQQAFPTVSEWVIAGENLLSVDLIELDPDPSRARLHVALCEATIGAVPEPGHERELCVIDWPIAPEPPSAPTTLREVGIASHPWGEWSWQRAPEFAADLRTTADVIDYVRSLHAELAAGRIDALVAHSATKFSEVAPAYAMSAAEAEQRLRGVWAALSSTPGWQLAAFDENDIELRLHCDGRLVEPTTLAGEPILRQLRAIDGERWSLPIFIARTHWEYTAGRLTIVR